MNRFEHIVRGLLQEADVQIGGKRKQDIHIHHPDFYRRVLAEGSLGLGESYMDEWWDANELPDFIEHVIRANLEQHVRWNQHFVWSMLLAHLSNRQSRQRSREVARKHYDQSGILPNPLLDPYNQYTCAYFDGTEDLNEAQVKKLDLICRKLQLQKEDRVLDIGCGWGGFARFAAERYGCHVTGISISEEQIAYASQFCIGLPVDIRFCDYRDLDGTFDKVLTCGMVEHVGQKNYRTLFKKIYSLLPDHGLYLLHTIGNTRSMPVGDRFLNRYIFPNGQIPSAVQIDQAREGLFSLQDFQNLSAHYPPTLLAWHRNMQSHWPELSEQYDNRFRRMFEYYLLASAGGFQADNVELWQMVLSKEGRIIDYRGTR